MWTYCMGTLARDSRDIVACCLSSTTSRAADNYLKRWSSVSVGRRALPGSMADSAKAKKPAFAEED